MFLKTVDANFFFLITVLFLREDEKLCTKTGVNSFISNCSWIIKSYKLWELWELWCKAIFSIRVPDSVFVHSEISGWLGERNGS